MSNKQRLHKLLCDAIPSLCRNGLPPSATFRVEALIGITVINDGGGDAVGEGNVMLLSFQQTVSDRGVITSQFGSNDSMAAVPVDGGTVSHTPRKRSASKQATAAAISMKQEYTVETSVKQEYDDAESYPPYASTSAYEEYGTADGEEVAYLGEDGDYVGEEEYYEDDGQYYDDGTGYPSNVKFETPEDAYMEGAGDGSYLQSDYMTDVYGQSSTGRPQKHKVAKPRLSAPGAQPGPSKVRKTGGTPRGGTRPRAGKASQDPAAAIAVS